MRPGNILRRRRTMPAMKLTATTRNACRAAAASVSAAPPSLLLPLLAALILSTSAVVCVDAVGMMESILSVFSSTADEDGDAKRPNNNHDILVERYGPEGYRRLISSAFGSSDPDSDEFCPDDSVPHYGADMSFPVHHPHAASSGYLGDRKSFYEDFLRGCRDYYQDGDGGRGKGRLCDVNEEERIIMNLRQPSSMQNYTELGFQKIRAPSKVYNMLKEFWEINHERQSVEKWPAGNTYTNHWHIPTYMVSVENARLPRGGYALKQRVWDAARDTIQQWIGRGTGTSGTGVVDQRQSQWELTPSSLYGIRVYKGGAVLAPHVDRLPLVSSAIINVAQDVDEPWPLEVYAHDGRAYNVTMEPGDMVLYESHSVIHGRPFPLKGRYYANVFIHFEPKGHSMRHNAKLEGRRSDKGESRPVAESQYRRAKEEKATILSEAKDSGVGDEEDDLPEYILKGSDEEIRWRQKNPGKNAKIKVSVELGVINAHQAAARGDVEALAEIAAEDKDALNRKDTNGWLPIHEAARGGHVEAIDYLVKNGADVNARTNKGKGGTPLWWAQQKKGKNHPAAKALMKYGALAIEPEV